MDEWQALLASINAGDPTNPLGRYTQAGPLELAQALLFSQQQGREAQAAARQVPITESERIMSDLSALQANANEATFPGVRAGYKWIEAARRPRMEKAAADAATREAEEAAAAQAAANEAAFKEFMRAGVEAGYSPQDLKAAWIAKQTGVNLPSRQEQDERKTQVVALNIDGKNVQALVDTQTGEVIRVLGEAKAEKPASAQYTTITNPDGSKTRVQVDERGQPVQGTELQVEPAEPPPNPYALSTTEVANYRKQEDAYRNVFPMIDSLFAKVKEHGTESWGANRADMEALGNDIMLQLKEINNLGVLNGPDLELMQTIVGDVTSLKPWAAGYVLKQLEGLKERLKIRLGTVQQRLEAGGIPTNDPLTDAVTRNLPGG